MAITIGLIPSGQFGYVPSGAGAAPYSVQGDPTVALMAQLNRFAGKSVSAGDRCGRRVFVKRELPLIDSLTDEAATAAVLLIHERYNCVPLGLYSAQKVQWAISGLNNSVVFVAQNLNEITLTIAQLGDSLGLPAAKAGITQVDPKLKPKSKAPYYIAGGVLVALLGVVAYQRRAR